MIQPAVRIHPRGFTQALKRARLGPVIQVPCSYFKDWLNFLWDSGDMEVINPVNEALAMGRAAGRFLATGVVPIVAMQNSGLMNTLNALTSLHQIYDIPAFFVVSWRGEGGPGSDVPVHDITGVDLLPYLRAMHLPFEIAEADRYERQIHALSETARETRRPVALVIRKDTFEPHTSTTAAPASGPSPEMTRYDAIAVVKHEAARADAVALSSTGFPSRDAFAVADTPDFYILGSMGHAFEIGLGVAEGTTRKVVVLDGDGSALMHVGGLADFDPRRHRNLIYVVLDNASYESTGGQPTASAHVDWEKLAAAFRFGHFRTTASRDDLHTIIGDALGSDGGHFIHVAIRNDDRPAPRMVSDVYTPRRIADRFMDDLRTGRDGA